MGAVFTTVATASGCAQDQESASGIRPEEARAIAREAYIYGNPMVDSYRILHTYFVEQSDPEYKAPWNQIFNVARVYTHEDTTIQGPNSDTPYSFVGIDLRTEPVVLTLPPIEEDRYFSIQLVDLYTHIVDYIGSRRTGNDGGSFLISGPGWNGEVPETIEKTIRSETELMLAIYRTQLFNPDDIDNVKRIQDGYTVQPLSAFLGQAPPESAPAIEFIEPLSADAIRSSPEVFNQLNFVLQFCAIHPSEADLMERFARLSIGAGRGFDVGEFTPVVRASIEQGIADAWVEFEELQNLGDAGTVTSADVFGSREHLQNNYAYRMAAAVMGIWGNSGEEADYPTYFVDSDGEPLDGANRYALRFPPGDLPPVNAFWSLTLYGLPDRLLVANPLDRYLLNSTMVEQFERAPDGGITLYIQNESPGTDAEANWLPAPEGPFYVVLRLYWPRPEALDGEWQQPMFIRRD
jgi:hypothetical protein